MIRGPHIKDLQEAGFHYISAISRPQIETLLVKGTLQMELFENELAEVFIPAQADGSIPAERYILRRNPVRKAEIQASRQDRQAALQRDIARLNTYWAVEVAGTIQLLLEPRADVHELLSAAGVTLPTVLPRTTTRVSTKKKLPKNRATRLK